MEQYRFAGYRIIEFPRASKVALQQIAERLIPRESEIVDRWIALQFSTWQPPGLRREDLRVLFSGLLHSILTCMASAQLEVCIADLEETGAGLAKSEFPYEALIISLHFLEESYMPFLLSPRSEHTQDWLIRMDEFLHVGIAALATSYFTYHKEQLLADAEIGRIVQEALFPHPPKTIGDMELGFVYASAGERARLGGDFLDVFAYAGDGAAFVIGDLSGHGLDAAADSATIRSLFKGFLFDSVELGDVVDRLNRVLIEELESYQFATAVAGRYRGGGRLSLVNAGGPRPILCGSGCRELQQSGLPLGVDGCETYRPVEVVLEPGSALVCYTDGLSEARVGSDLFGEDRIVEIVGEMHDAPPRAIAEHLKDQALRHANGRLMDDMAILVLKRSDSA